MLEPHRVASAALLVAAASAGASADIVGFAANVEGFFQGAHRNGGAVEANRSNPAAALHEPQRNDTMNFVSLGIGGELIVSFADRFTESVTVWETTFGNNPGSHFETADIFVSASAGVEGAEWWRVGSVANTADGLPISLAGVMDESGHSAFRFLRIVDTTPRNSPSTDGFDVDGVRAVLVPTPASLGVAALGGLALARRRRR